MLKVHGLLAYTYILSKKMKKKRTYKINESSANS